MNYKQLVDYMKLQKYTDDQIKRTIIFLDNQEYYETTKKLNQEIIEEVQKTNEIITENVLEFKKEEVVKVQKEELQETLSNIILDLKPEELKIKFLQSNVDKVTNFDNIDFLMKVIPETSTKYEALKDVKTELELKPISTISSKQPEDYTLSSYNKELNIDLSKPKENLDINFSKPTQKFDTSSLEPKIITPIDYSNVEIKSKDYLNTIKTNDIPLDLSKPKMVNVEYPKQETIIPTKVEVKSNDIPTTPKVLNNDETFGNYIERTFSNIENKKYTLSGLDELVKDLNTYKEKETNPQKKEIFEVLETSAFSQFVVSIDEYNKNFNKEIIDNVKTQINQNNKEINIQEDIKRYEEEHKNDSKVKDSSIFSFTLLGALLNNLNATYITQEEYQEKQKQHSKMLQEKDLDTQKYEEKLELKKEEEKDKNYKSLGYFSAVSTLMYYKNLEYTANSLVFNQASKNYEDSINNGHTSLEETKEDMAKTLNASIATISSIADFFTGENQGKIKKLNEEVKRKIANGENLDDVMHVYNADIADIVFSDQKAFSEMVKTNHPILGDIRTQSITRNITVEQNLSNKIDTTRLKNLEELERIGQINNLEQKELDQIRKNVDSRTKYKENTELLKEKDKILKDLEQKGLTNSELYRQINKEFYKLKGDVEDKVNAAIYDKGAMAYVLKNGTLEKSKFVDLEDSSSNFISKEKSSIFSKKDSNDSFVHSFEDM